MAKQLVGHHLLRVRIRKKIFEDLQEISEEASFRTNEHVTVSDLVRSACYNYILMHESLRNLEAMVLNSIQPETSNSLELDQINFDEMDEESAQEFIENASIHGEEYAVQKYALDQQFNVRENEAALLSTIGDADADDDAEDGADGDCDDDYDDAGDAGDYDNSNSEAEIEAEDIIAMLMQQVDSGENYKNDELYGELQPEIDDESMSVDDMISYLVGAHGHKTEKKLKKAIKKAKSSEKRNAHKPLKNTKVPADKAAKDLLVKFI